MSKLLFESETFRILGAGFTVYKEMGPGFLESVYQECMEIELGSLGIPFSSQPLAPIQFKGAALKTQYRPNIICFDSVLVELKACSKLLDEHRAQLLNYLRATGIQVGLLLNFGHHPLLEHERFVKT
ncbi:MAG TPA: GxxExxY protein [Kiritimatiellia bacterium]|nr:GxxExxY protein [Kiritimatiellia bacterium]